MRRWLRNPGWKLLSIFLAYLFWLAVIEEKQAIRQLEIPIRFENLDPSLALVRDRPSSVIVRVQASEPIVKELTPPDIEAHIDLRGFGQGTHLVRLSPASPSIVPRNVGVRVIEVFPSGFEVHLEPKLTADVPVSAAITGIPAEGFEVAEVRVEPARVRIEGPESAVKRTTEARTREVAIDGKRGSLQQEVWIDVAHPDVMVASEPRARVLVAIRESVGERTVSDIPVARVGGEFEARISPKHARITVRGPERILAGFTREDVVAYVDLNGLEPRAEDYRLPVVVAFTRDVMRERLQVVTVAPTPLAVRVLRRRPASSQPAVPGG